MSALTPAAAGGRGAPVTAGQLRLVLLARPGAGKSTQARRLAESLNVAHLSTGELLRAEVAAGTELGQQVAAAIARGDLVPDEVMEGVLGPRLERAAAAGGYVLDGYPRDLRQAMRLAELTPAGLAPRLAISLEVGPRLSRQRLLARASDEGRGDDTPATIDRRLGAYERDMGPVLRWYEEHGQLVRVSGEGTPVQVTERILAAAGLGLRHRGVVPGPVRRPARSGGRSGYRAG